MNLPDKQACHILWSVYVQNLILYKIKLIINITVNRYSSVPCIKCLNNISLSSLDIRFGHHFNVDWESMAISCKLDVSVNVRLYNYTNNGFTKLKVIHYYQFSFNTDNFSSVVLFAKQIAWPVASMIFKDSTLIFL